MTNRSHLQRTGRVLCLDGGGIKGLVMTQMLYVLEEMLGKPIQECFDWISGTSTGGFLALMVCMGKDTRTLKQKILFKEDMKKNNKHIYINKGVHHSISGSM